jgi:hypothetical protein
VYAEHRRCGQFDERDSATSAVSATSAANATSRRVGPGTAGVENRGRARVTADVVTGVVASVA